MEWEEKKRIKKWKAELHRIQVLKKKFSNVNVNKLEKPKHYFNTLVDFVNYITEFYDEGLLELAPENKGEFANNFNNLICVLLRREKSPVSYWNTTKPGEKVTVDNLFLGLAEPISQKKIKKFHIANLLIQEYNDKLYYIDIPPIPIAKFLQGNIKSLKGEKIVLDYKKISNLVTKMQEEVVTICDSLLKDEEF
jgi:hypothetical protein